MNHYEILGIEPTATADDIKAAYRKLAQRLHPDKKTGNRESFEAVLAAYRVLSDAARRKEYDETGTNAPPPVDDLLPFLSKLVLGVLDEHEDEIDTIDVVAIMRKHMQAQKEKAVAALGETEAKIEKRANAIAKIKTNQQENVLAGLIGADMKRQELLAEATRNAIAMLERGLMILADYQFDYTALLARPRMNSVQQAEEAYLRGVGNLYRFPFGS